MANPEQQVPSKVPGKFPSGSRANMRCYNITFHIVQSHYRPCKSRALRAGPARRRMVRCWIIARAALIHFAHCPFGLRLRTNCADQPAREGPIVMSEQRPRVVVVGEAIIEFVRGGDGRFVLGCAGDTFNVAIYLARAGMDAAFATALGEDR